MARASDIDDEPDVSSLETHFVAREDDDETLWDVREIIAEKGRMYQVLWEGVDPKTNQPWPPDWVPKEDCTDPLVLAWKRKKAAKKAEKKRGRNSISSRVSATSRMSTGSSATVTRTSVSTSTKPKLINAGMKRKRDEGFASTSSRTSRPSLALENVSSAPPKKKQKVASKSPSIATRSSSSRVTPRRHNGRKVRAEEEEESSEDEREIISRLKQSKHNPRPHKHSPIDLVSSSDEEPSRPKARPNNVKKGTSSKPITAKLAGAALKSFPPVPKTSRPHATVASEAPSIQGLNNPPDTVSKRPRPVLSDFSDDNSPPKPPRRAKLKQVHTGGKAVLDSSPPRVSPTSPKVVKRARTPSASPSSYDSPSPSSHDTLPSLSLLIPSLQTTRPEAPNIRRDDDEDSALEYVELPIPSQPNALPTPPSAQISRKQSLSPQLQSQPVSVSPSTAPAPSHSSRTPESPRLTLPHAQDSQFVSETEGEESQQLRKRINQPPPPLLRSPSKSSFTSRMKPRTPGSKRYVPDTDLIASPLPYNDDGDDGNDSPKSRAPKRLGPLPQLSPSKFLTLPSSTIESANSPRTGNKHDDTIEEFESPDKSAGNRKGGKGVGTATGTTSQEIPDSTGGSGSTGESLPVPSAATNVIDKGVAMADAAKRAKLNGLSTQARVTLNAIIENEKEKQRLRSVSRASDYETGEEEDEEKEGEEESQRDGQGVPSTLEEFADSFVDYDAEIAQDISQGQTQDQDEPTKTDETQNIAGDEPRVKVFERQEEEESTQDVLAEMQEQQQLLQQLERAVPDEGGVWVHPAAPLPLSSQAPQSGDEEMGDVGSSLEVAPPKSSGPIIDSLLDSASQPQPASQHTPDKRVHPMEPQTPEIPPTISPTRPEPEFLFSSSSQSQDPQLEAAMNLLNKKSEEISRLESLLAVAQATTRSLEAQKVTLQSLCTARENQVSVLTSSIQSLESKVSFTENSAEVFRRQYLEASRYASEVMAENNNLRERIEVAESQVSTGVSGIRTMFERRVQELEKEAAYHRQLATFVMEQTKRTGDEEIRKRAAEYPEMEMRCKDMENRLEGASGMIDTLERLITMRDKDIGDLRKEKREEKERIQMEMETLREELETLKKKEHIVNGEHRTPISALGGMESLPVSEVESKSALNLANGDMTAAPEVEMVSKPPTPREDVPGDIVVYRCLWRKDGSDRCDAMFLTKEELRCHLESCGHLQ